MSIWQHSLQIWRLILKDKGAMLLLFVAGLVYSFFYPLPYHFEQVESVPTLLVDQDQSASSRNLTRLLEAAPQLQLISITNDPQQITERLWRGDVMAMLVIPVGFHEDLLAGRSTQVQLASHGGYLLAGSKALLNASEAVLTMGAALSLQKAQAMGVSWQQALENAQPLDLQTRALYNPQDGYGHSIVPAVMVLIIQQTLLIGVTLLLGRQAELGALPLGAKAYWGMLLTFTSIALINCLYFFVVASQLQHYNRIGQLGSLLGFALVFCVCIAAFALILGRLFKTRERGLQLLLLTSVPMLFVSGYSWPAESLPQPLYYARWLLPTTAGIHGFVSINQLGASLLDVGRELAALALLAGALIALGLRLYRHAD